MSPIVQHHHDGHGLADSMTIKADERDPEAGNASHNYQVVMLDEDGAAYVPARIDFQHGPRDVEGSQAGILDSVLLAILIDRYEGFQDGRFACRENAIVITKLQEALHWMKHRANDRARRGVLGKNAE